MLVLTNPPDALGKHGAEQAVSSWETWEQSTSGWLPLLHTAAGTTLYFIFIIMFRLPLWWFCSLPPHITLVPPEHERRSVNHLLISLWPFRTLLLSLTLSLSPITSQHSPSLAIGNFHHEARLSGDVWLWQFVNSLTRGHLEPWSLCHDHCNAGSGSAFSPCQLAVQLTRGEADSIASFILSPVCFSIKWNRKRK